MRIQGVAAMIPPRPVVMGLLTADSMTTAKKARGSTGCRKSLASATSILNSPIVIVPTFAGGSASEEEEAEDSDIFGYVQRSSGVFLLGVPAMAWIIGRMFYGYKKASTLRGVMNY
jgi:hypothetical protein